MKLFVHGKNVQVTEALKQYAEEKLGRLAKFAAADDAELHVALSVYGRGPRHKVEVTLQGGGLAIRAEEATDDMYASIDAAAAKLAGQFRRWKGKIRRRLLRGGIRVLADEELAQTEPEDDGEFPVGRIKQVELKPVDLQEAILQMNLLDHSFHVFVNADTGRTEVVYKRGDGSYGLIRSAVS